MQKKCKECGGTLGGSTGRAAGTTADKVCGKPSGRPKGTTARAMVCMKIDPSIGVRMSLLMPTYI